MSEFVAEWSGYSSSPALQVSEQATHALALQLTIDCDPVARRDSIVNELRDKNPVMLAAFVDLVLVWGIDDELIESFEDGFTIGYKLLDFESELTGRQLSAIKADSLDSFYNQMAARWLHPYDYFNSSTENLGAHNVSFLRSLFDYIDGTEVKAAKPVMTFLLGGVVTHDLLHHQGRIDGMLDQYVRDSNPGSSSIH